MDLRASAARLEDEARVRSALWDENVHAVAHQRAHILGHVAVGGESWRAAAEQSLARLGYELQVEYESHVSSYKQPFARLVQLRRDGTQHAAPLGV